MPDFGPFWGGLGDPPKTPDFARFWAFLGPGGKSPILAAGRKNPDFLEISKSEAHKFANYLSRLGELLNTLQNVHFFAPPLPKSGISGGGQGGLREGSQNPPKCPFFGGFRAPQETPPKPPFLGVLGGGSPRPARPGQGSPVREGAPRGGGPWSLREADLGAGGTPPRTVDVDSAVTRQGVHVRLATVALLPPDAPGAQGADWIPTGDGRCAPSSDLVNVAGQDITIPPVGRGSLPPRCCVQRHTGGGAASAACCNQLCAVRAVVSLYT